LAEDAIVVARRVVEEQGRYPSRTFAPVPGSPPLAKPP
jgi:hypothetical protein